PVDGELRCPVGVDYGPARTDGADDEIAVPGGELLQRRQQLVALRAPLRPPDPLLGLAHRQVERLDVPLGLLLRGLATLADAVEDPLRRRRRLELRIRVDTARDLEQRSPALLRIRVEQPPDAVEPAGR